MKWNDEHREKIYHVIDSRWNELDLDSWEVWLKELGIEWAELDDDVRDAPPGTVAIWEGPGVNDETKKQCWVVPDDVAMKLLVLGQP